jgi:hypothetical protein
MAAAGTGAAEALEPDVLTLVGVEELPATGGRRPGAARPLLIALLVVRADDGALGDDDLPVALPASASVCAALV